MSKLCEPSPFKVHSPACYKPVKDAAKPEGRPVHVRCAKCGMLTAVDKVEGDTVYLTAHTPPTKEDSA